MTTVGTLAGTFAETPGIAPDPFDPRRARHAPGLLRQFNDAGVLSAADVHVALRLAVLAGLVPEGSADHHAGTANPGDGVLLAAALAVRAPRLGHVCVDLATVRSTVTIDTDAPVDLQKLPWPDARDWIDRVAASPLVACGVDGAGGRPLRLAGSLLYLDRYWTEERDVATDLAARAAETDAGVDETALAAGLTRLFGPSPAGGKPDYQALAAAAAVHRRLAVVAGGPGTGKTTTVARILALLDEQASAAGAQPPLVALAAPTGKAAARLEQAVHEEAARLDVSNATRERLLACEAKTIHRLLGWRPGNRSRFRHDRGNQLPHEVVIVDETSMVSLSLMARLLEAVRPTARLVLVGDPEQLASVEAGAVLGDIVGPPGERSSTPAVAGGVVVLRDVHRFGGAIATLAEAVRTGDAAGALRILSQASPDVVWVPVDAGGRATAADLRPIQNAVLDAGERVVTAAKAGHAGDALQALSSFRLLCAHRRGIHGVEAWSGRVERWLAAGVDGFSFDDPWYAGRPLLVTENDYGLRLFNGDTGVVVSAGDGRVVAVFERRGELAELSPTRLAAVETVYAMTVHKSQGSQFDTVAVVMPDATSPILTRELLYTAITRARRRLILTGTEAAVAAAVERPIARASGLRRWLAGGRCG